MGEGSGRKPPGPNNQAQKTEGENITSLKLPNKAMLE